MKKLFIGSLVAVFAFAMTINIAFADIQTGASSAAHNITVSLQVTSGISLMCYETGSATDTHTVTMPAIAEDGTSNDSATCNVRTNNSAGYNLDISGVGALASGGDQIAAYTGGAVWSVASNASAWGYQLDNGNWSGGATGLVGTYATETGDSGVDETIEFQAEVGTSYIQPTGTYTDTVTFTATTL